MVSLKIHNIMDYVGGVFLILTPYLFGFSDIGVARAFYLLCGATLIIYSLLTKYEFALIRILPLGVHMTLDVLIGVGIFVAPWIFDYRVFLSYGQEYLHYMLGFGLFVLVGFTAEKTEADKREHHVTVGV